MKVASSSVYAPHGWPSGAELKANDMQLRREAEDEIAEFEAQYGISSAEMRGRLLNDEIQETAEICTWLMDLEILDAVTHAGGI